MEEILGLTPTGRELRDPAARLLEATDGDGRHYTVLSFDPAHHGHAALTLNVDLVLSFMQFPMVTGLVGLAHHDLKQGLFAFGTGSVWTLAEIARAFSDFGQVVGLRAGLELAWLAAQVLVEAGETGPMQGCFSHGNVCPTRLALRADGQVQVFGHGLAQVEVMRHRESDYPLEPASLRYCPPERLEGVPEDAAADTYALTLVVYELITGKPLLDSHDLEELTRMVGMSEGATLLSRSNAGLPPKVAKVLARSLIYDPDTRLSGQDYVDAIGGLLANEALDGPSLSEVVEKLQGQGKQALRRGRKLVAAKSTTAFTPEMLAQLAAEDDDDDDDQQAAPRWSKVKRSRKGSEDDEAAADASSTSDGPKRSRRRREAAEATPSEDSAEPSSRRRRRRSPEEPKVEASTADEPKRRRRRAPKPEAAPEAEAAPPAEPKRRRRRKAPEAEPEATPATEPKAAAGEGEGEVESPPDKAEPAKSRRRRKPPAEAEAEAPTPSRRRRRSPAPAEEPAAESESPAPTRRRRGSDDDDDDAPRRRRRARPDEDDDDAPPRRRRKRSAAEAAEADAAPDDDKPSPRRRRRKPKS